jgi:hypothetical protein
MWWIPDDQWKWLINTTKATYDLTAVNNRLLSQILSNKSHLSPEDQKKLNKIFATVAEDRAKIESATSSVQLKEGVTRMTPAPDHTLDDTLAAVTAEDAGVDSVVAFVAGLKQQLADALAGVTLPAAVQTKVNAIFDQATASAAKIATAIAASP